METPRTPVRSGRMTPEGWQQVKAILSDAIECDDALQRAALVESSCAGDPLLRREVEALLAYADDSGDPGRPWERGVDEITMSEAHSAAPP